MGTEPAIVIPDISIESLRGAIAEVCEQKGWHHGIPMPSMANVNARIVMAKGCPLADGRENRAINLLDDPSVQTCSHSDVNEATSDAWVMNEWTVPHTRVVILRDNEGVYKLRQPQAKQRLRMQIDSALLRSGAVSMQSELKAMNALSQYINSTQMDCYFLSGMFPETSKRSGVTYLFRRGLPTLALKIRANERGLEERHFLAALCLHPLAYYHNTFCGCTPPSDEVMTHLLLMRTDEHRFWKKSGQHPIDDPRAGV